MNLHCLPSQRLKSIFNITKVDIFEDKYLSQDLSCILHNTVEGSGVEISGGREGAVILAPRRTCLPACLPASSGTAPRQTHDVDTVLA